MNKDIIIKETLYNTLIASGVDDRDIDHHFSDLYLRMTPRNIELLHAYYRKQGLPEYLPDTFRSNIEGDGLWFDIPFEYLPYWKDKMEGKATK